MSNWRGAWNRMVDWFLHPPEVAEPRCDFKALVKLRDGQLVLSEVRCRLGRFHPGPHEFDLVPTQKRAENRVHYDGTRAPVPPVELEEANYGSFEVTGIEYDPDSDFPLPQIFDAPAVCGERSLTGRATCDEVIDHEGPHTGTDDEGRLRRWGFPMHLIEDDATGDVRTYGVAIGGVGLGHSDTLHIGNEGEIEVETDFRRQVVEESHVVDAPPDTPAYRHRND